MTQVLPWEIIENRSMKNSWKSILGVYVLAIASILAVSSGAFGQVSIDSFPSLNPNQDWPWWRGVSRDGHASDQSAPTTLDEAANLDWAQPIRGRGHGSPVVVGNRVLLLTADEEDQVHYAVALDRGSGKPVWEVELNRGGFPGKNHPKNTEASPTIACDGQQIYINLFHHEAIWLTALDMDGQKVWEKRLGGYNPRLYKYGYAASPVLYGDMVIAVYEYDGPSALVAVSRKDGSEVWRTARPSMITFSSPTITTYEGQDYLLISGSNKVMAYNPATGKEIWSSDGTALATCGTIVWDSGLIFASGGYPASETVAMDIRTGEAKWRVKQKAYEQSMVAANGYLYCYADGGILYCWDAKTGRERWKQRLEDRISASGVLVRDHIYWANEAGYLYVFQADPSQYTPIARNKIGDQAFASPAICGGQVFLRVAKFENDTRQEYVMRFSNR
jgi:outer membrane protein assembly factor BamB